jgi:hypothetical protein
VDSQDERGPVAESALVVLNPRAVGRSDFHEARARAGEHVGDPEPVADLDELAARDEHIPALGQSGDCQEDRRGVVVDDERGLRTGQLAEQRSDVVLARPARAFVQVVFEVGVAGRRLAHALERLLGQRRATEVRVDDDTCRVEDAPQSRRRDHPGQRNRASAQIAGLAAVADRLAGLGERRASGRNREHVSPLSLEFRHAGIREKVVDAGQCA